MCLRAEVLLVKEVKLMQIGGLEATSSAAASAVYSDTGNILAQ